MGRSFEPADVAKKFGNKLRDINLLNLTWRHLLGLTHNKFGLSKHRFILLFNKIGLVEIRCFGQMYHAESF